MSAIEDDRTRTPPHGDALQRAAQRVAASAREVLGADVSAVDRRMRALALDMAGHLPVRPVAIYRALLHHSAKDVEAAITEAMRQGVDPGNFSQFLPLPTITIPAANIETVNESDTALALLLSITVAEAMEGAAAFARILGADPDTISMVDLVEQVKDELNIRGAGAP